MKILGIDVGIDGALAAIEGEQRNLNVELHDLPTIGAKSKREIDVPQLANIIRAAKPDMAYIENVWAMPSIEDEVTGERRGMGAASAWRFGLGIGQIRGCVATLDIPYTLVVPQRWMKLFGLKGNDKESHRQYAIRRVPSAAPFLTLKKNHQRADALLLALYGMIYQTGESSSVRSDRGSTAADIADADEQQHARSIDDELDQDEIHD